MKDKDTKEPFDSKLGVSMRIVNLAMSPEFNMTFYPGAGTVDGVKGDHIIIAPPFIVKKQDIDHIIKVFPAVLEQVLKEIDKDINKEMQDIQKKKPKKNNFYFCFI